MQCADGHDYYKYIMEAATVVRDTLGTAGTAVVLGSGLGNFVRLLENREELPFSKIPHMPTTTVPGHQGKLYVGDIGCHRVYCLAGRVHAYEGFHMHQLTFFVRVLYFAGCRILLSTNAAGGAIPEAHRPGTIVVLRDHINFMHRAPNEDTYEDTRLSFPNARVEYSVRLGQLAFEAAQVANVNIVEGVYGYTCGPTFETAAEILAYRAFGATVFGMSTVPEVVAAASLGMEVFAMSLVTNLATGLSNNVLTHEEVQYEAANAGPHFERILQYILATMEETPVRTASGLAPGVALIPRYVLPRRHASHPTATPPTYDELAAAARYLVRALGGQPAGMAIFVAQGMGVELIGPLGLTDASKTVRVSQLPHFLHVTPSGREGVILTGWCNGINILLFEARSFEGWTAGEMTFLLGMLRLAGIHDVLQLVAVHRFQGLDDMSNWMSVQEVLNLTQDVPDVQHDYRWRDLPSVRDNELVEMPVLLRVAVIPGPCIPTQAEAGVLFLSGARGVTHCRIHVGELAAQLGLNALVLARSGPVAADAVIKWILRRALVLHDRTMEVNVDMDEATPMEIPPKPASHVATEFYQGVDDHVQAAAEHVRQGAGALLEKVALVVMLEDEAWVGYMKTAPLLELDYRDVPHAPPDLSGRILFLPTPDTDRILVVLTTMNYMHHTARPSELSFWVRVIATLTRAPQLSIVSGVVTPVPGQINTIQPGQLVPVRDHINLSGRNPLFGSNHAHWGLRFVDMTAPYDAPIRQFMHEEFISAEDSTMPMGDDSVAAYVCHPALARARGLAGLARACGAHIMINGGVPQLIVARHMSIRAGIIALSIGAISESPAYGSLVTATDVRAMEQALVSLWALLPRIATRLPNAIPAVPHPLAAKCPAKREMSRRAAWDRLRLTVAGISRSNSARTTPESNSSPVIGVGKDVADDGSPAVKSKEEKVDITLKEANNKQSVDVVMTDVPKAAMASFSSQGGRPDAPRITVNGSASSSTPPMAVRAPPPRPSEMSGSASGASSGSSMEGVTR